LAFVLKKEKLNDLLKIVSKTYKIIAPLKDGDSINFKPVKPEEFSKIELNYTRSTKSPKEFYFPQTEEICKFKYSGRDVDIVPSEIENEKKAIVGIHPCDVRAIGILDKLFNWDYRDEHYFTRRENNLLVSITCSSPDWNCFCTSLEGAPYDSSGTDIHLSDLNGFFYIEAISEKGEKVLKEAESIMEKATGEHEKKLQELQKKIEEQVPVNFDNEKVVKNLEGIFDHEIWDSISEKCVHCGACAYLCPTCHCFDISDEGNYDDSKRIRCWDVCMSTKFTRMAGGHNPRNDVKTRYRQRIMHKFNYYLKNFDTISCVGCGRCISECPAGMDLVKTLQTIETIEGDKK